MSSCIFCKIIRGDVPASKVFENEEVIAFHDLHPKAPVHLLLVPKQHIESLFTTTSEDQALLGQLLLLAPMIARQQGLTDGFKTVVNTGIIGEEKQEVFHLHLHVLGYPSKVMIRKGTSC